MAVNVIYELDFLHGVSLPTGTHTASDVVEVRENGSAVQIDILDDLNDISGFSSTSWADVNPSINSVVITLQVTLNGGTSWATHSGLAVADILPSDVTIVSTNAVTQGVFTIALQDGSITANVLHDATQAFRLRVVVDNS